MKRPELDVLEEKMTTIAKNYFLARRYLNYTHYISEDNFALLCSYIGSVKKAFTHLKNEEQKLLNNEYFYEAPLDWWKKEYSLQGYNNLKNTAIAHFLEVFHVGY